MELWKALTNEILPGSGTDQVGPSHTEFRLTNEHITAGTVKSKSQAERASHLDCMVPSYTSVTDGK